MWRWKDNIHLVTILCGRVNNNNSDDDDNNNNNLIEIHRYELCIWLILWNKYVMLQIAFPYHRVLDALRISGGKYGKYEH